jgi:hypothetical protein
MPILLSILAFFVILFGFVVFRGAPYVPSQKKWIRRAFKDLYLLSSKDTLVDVGSGDGVVLRLAAEKGATAIGYELNPLLVLISRMFSRRYPKIRVQLADFWLTPLPKETTIVYVFSVSRDIKKIENKMQNESNRLDKSIKVMTYGSWFKDKKVDKTLDAYHLYTFYPLQSQ